MRVGILVIVLLLVSVQKDHTRFLHPKRTVILTAAGWVEFPLQAFVARHPDNRAYRLSWFGESCGGAASADLEGEDAPAIQPTKPILVRSGTGICELELQVYAAGGKVRERKLLNVRICGGGVEECS